MRRSSDFYKKTLTALSGCLITVLAHAADNAELLFIKNMTQYIQVASEDLEKLIARASLLQPKDYLLPEQLHTIPLFDAYPTLQKNLPYVALGDLPTPIEKLTSLGSLVGAHQVYIKRDDLSGKKLQNGHRLFGGNKVRKLEFLLADALRYGANSVLTLGCVGSNHVVATAAYANAIGLKSIAMLKPQPNAQVVRRNLLLMHQYGAKLILSSDNVARDRETVNEFLYNKYINGDFPYFVPTGGSCPIGVLGFVNAAFELKQQIEHGLLPEPDRIYVAAGSVGTTVGLMLGIRAAQLKTKVYAVCIEPEVPDEFEQKMMQLFRETNALLHSLDSSFPLYTCTQDDMHILYDFCGKQYGLFTQEGMQAIQLLQETEGIVLDGTYTAKAFSAFLHDITHQDVSNEVVVFWHTFCGDAKPTSTDYLLLPHCFHRYFEDAVQQLDQMCGPIK